MPEIGADKCRILHLEKEEKEAMLAKNKKKNTAAYCLKNRFWNYGKIL